MQHLLREVLSTRVLPDGGLADRPNGQFRVDSTAWGILSLMASGAAADLLDRSRARLKVEQGEDGRVSLSRSHPGSFWPTALAILAWQDSPASQAAQKRAAEFLLGTTGVHIPRKPDAPGAHDTALKGWPWIEDTHSWIEPTALGMTALRAIGYANHDRVHEAVRMILDRQLPHGGWNVGNTLIYGRELHPNPEGTGSALAGIAGVVAREQVSRSIEYLQGEVDRLYTPISLGWALLGLGAWGRWPSNGAALVERCLTSQSRYGEYDTSALSLLCLGALAGESSANHPMLARSGFIRSASVGEEWRCRIR